MWGKGISYHARLVPTSLLSIVIQKSCNNGGLFYFTECPVRDL